MSRHSSSLQSPACRLSAITAVSQSTFYSFMDSPFPGKYHNTFWHDILHHQQWHCPFSDRALQPAAPPSPGTSLPTGQTLQRCCQNVKFYIQLLSAAELNHRKGGGQAGPRSLYWLKGWECPRKAGHWHLTKCFPKEKKTARESYPCMHECHRSSKY